MRKNSSNSKISEFDDILLGQEDVLGLEISMDDLPIVNMLNRQTNLSEHVQHQLFREVLEPSSRFLLGVPFLDLGLEIAAYESGQKSLPSA